MRKPIAQIRISAGNPGWYDSLTNIHLTIARPFSFVYEGQNTTNIKNAIRHRIISVVEGDLDPVISPIAEEVREVIEPVIEPTPIKEEKIEKQEAPVEEIKEAPVVEEEKEEVVEEQPKKKATKKKATKKSEKVAE